MDDVIINKIAKLDHYLSRVKEVYQEDFLKNINAQDVAILNLLRAGESCLDIGSHVICKLKLGIPQSNKDIFIQLEKNELITNKISICMQKMAGFRNIAIHEYDDVDINIVVGIITNHLNDFQEFSKQILKIDELNCRTWQDPAPLSAEKIFFV